MFIIKSVMIEKAIRKETKNKKKMASKIVAVVLSSIAALAMLLVAMLSIPAAVFEPNNITYVSVCFGAWILSLPLIAVWGWSMSLSTVDVEYELIPVEDPMMKVNPRVAGYCAANNITIVHVDMTGYVTEARMQDGSYINGNTILSCANLEDRLNEAAVSIDESCDRAHRVFDSWNR